MKSKHINKNTSSKVCFQKKNEITVIIGGRILKLLGGQPEIAFINSKIAAAFVFFMMR
ncbi:hypothetical protein [Labilibaculum manganireducens]|uniref:hypothetical protein n=1 Tax=Labilibaculum manganireducens TaxID=1940525 RepID=UPI0029F59ED7|nr:hypothetical protein [Labilibaculum manganireducens]